MTPVLQDQFIATHGKGNCVQACVASLLDMPLHDVPAFRDAQYMEEAIDLFLAERGLCRLAVYFCSGFEWGDARLHTQYFHPRAKCYVSGIPAMAFGKSPRFSAGHAVIIRFHGASMNGDCNWQLVHDPHPDGTGIDGDPTSLHFIVPLNPQEAGTQS